MYLPAFDSWNCFLHKTPRWSQNKIEQCATINNAKAPSAATVLNELYCTKDAIYITFTFSVILNF